jgi:hypothetical protein
MAHIRWNEQPQQAAAAVFYASRMAELEAALESGAGSALLTGGTATVADPNELGFFTTR